jgi:hypothetical protein
MLSYQKEKEKVIFVNEQQVFFSFFVLKSSENKNEKEKKRKNSAIARV